MSETNTDTTAPDSGNTDTSGQADQETGKNIQDVETRFVEYESRLNELAGLEQQKIALEEELKKHQAEALRWQASYKGLQKQTTARMQEAADLTRRMQEAKVAQGELQAVRGEMNQIQQTMALLAGKLLDEEAAKDFRLQQREMLIKQAEENLKNRVAAPAAQNEPQSYADPDEQKRQFLEYYFPGSGIDHNNSDIDWGEGASSTPEAFRRFTTSVMKIQGSKGQQPEVQAASATHVSDVQKLMEDFRKEKEEFDKSRAQLLEEAKTIARKETETKLRKTGIDVNAPSGIPSTSPKAITRLNELDENSLNVQDPEMRRAASRKFQQELRALRDEITKPYTT